MRNKEFAEAYKGNFLGHWTKISQIRKPIIAAVSGYAVSLIAGACMRCAARTHG
jgi:enoyl-CoA hydratase